LATVDTRTKDIVTFDGSNLIVIVKMIKKKKMIMIYKTIQIQRSVLKYKLC